MFSVCKAAIQIIHGGDIMNRSTQPTMKDVAREAGVALGTVSRVFNGYPVGEEYRARVEAAAKKLNYRVNNYARGLKTNKTNCVALLMPSPRHPFFAALIDALTVCLMRRGYLTHLMITNFDPDAEEKAFTLVEQNKVDGIIALTYRPAVTADPSIPIVSIDRQFNDRIPCVSSDNYHGGQLAAEKLIELGCRRLLFLRIGPLIQSEADRRGPGFEEACRRTGVNYEMLLVNDDETEAPIYRFLDQHCHDGHFDFDGIFCNTDGLAKRVCTYLTGQRIRIPDELQVIGYDGIIDFATGRYVCSTIVQPVAQMAEAAVDQLLSAEAGAPAALCRLPVHYVPGGTTRDAAPTVGDPLAYDPFHSSE